MIAFFTMLWNYRKVVIPALLFAALAISLGLAHYRLKERDAAILATKVAQASLETTQRVAAAKIDAMQSTMEDTDERNKFIQNTEQGIQQDKTAGDGPLAPVLRDALGRLRQRQAASAMRH